MRLKGIAAISVLLMSGMNIFLVVPEIRAWFPPDKIPAETLDHVFRGIKGGGNGFGLLATRNFLFMTTFVSGEGLRIHRTSDGLTWEFESSLKTTSYGYGRLIEASNGSIFLSHGENYPVIERSDDQGISWTIVKTIEDRHLHSIAWYNDSLFVASGDTNKTIQFWNRDMGWQDVSVTLNGYRQQGLHFFEYGNSLFLSTENTAPSSSILKWTGTGWQSVAGFEEFKGISAIWSTAIDGNRIYFGAGDVNRKFPVLVYSDDMSNYHYTFAPNADDAILAIHSINNTLYYFTSNENYFYKGYLGSDSQATFRRIFLPSSFIGNAYGWYGSVYWKGQIYFGASSANIFRLTPEAETDRKRFEGSFDGTVLTPTEWGLCLGKTYDFSMVYNDDFEETILSGNWQAINISGNLAQYDQSGGMLWVNTTGEVGGFYSRFAKYSSFKLETTAKTSGGNYNSIAFFFYVNDTSNLFYIGLKKHPEPSIWNRKMVNGTWVTEGLLQRTLDTGIFRNYSLVVEEGSNAKLYVDGSLVFDQNLPMGGCPGYIGIGTLGGAAWFEDFKAYNMNITYKTHGSFQTNWIYGGLADPSWSLIWYNASIDAGQSVILQVNGKDTSNETGTTMKTLSLSSGLNYYQINEIQGYRYVQLKLTLATDDNSTTPILHQGYGLQVYDIYPLIIKESDQSISAAFIQDNNLTLVVEAPIGSISTTCIYVDSKGEPMAVIGTSFFSYNSSAYVLTLSPLHSGSQTIIVTWKVESLPIDLIMVSVILALTLISCVWYSQRHKRGQMASKRAPTQRLRQRDK